MLEAKGLQVTIGDISVCRDLNFTVEPGRCWGLLGRNGAGKTTLLHTLAGLRPPQTGTVLLNQHPLDSLPRRAIAQRMGVLFQEESNPFPATVLETALIGRHPYLGRWTWEDHEDIERARHALRQMAINDLAERQVATLSGGERRRLALATLLTQDPDVLLLDEPTNHLDLHHQISVLKYLRQLASQNGKAILIILHDINLATRFCDHLLLLLGNGDTIAGPATEVLNAGTLEALYQHPVTRVHHDGRDIWVPR